MKVYNYDDATGAYLGELEADADPMAPVDENGEPTAWLLPAHATFVAPPEPMPNATTTWVSGAWQYVPNAQPEVTPEVTPPANWVPPPDLPPIVNAPVWVPPKAVDESKNAPYSPPIPEAQWNP